MLVNMEKNSRTLASQAYWQHHLLPAVNDRYSWLRIEIVPLSDFLTLYVR